MIKIDLKYQNGFRWYQKDGISVKGYLYDSGNVLYQHEELISYFSPVTDFMTFRDKIGKANGMFSVVIAREEAVMIGSDIIRSFPVFYYQGSQIIHISDNAQFLAETYFREVNGHRSIEYLATGYATGKFTLFTDIYQVQPGQIIRLENGTEEKSEFYFSYVTDHFFEPESDNLELRLQETISNVFDRLIRSVGNRQIIVPLSGGYDSRLIAVMLKNKGVNDVICITYGKKDSGEVSISKKVASALGYKWIFTEHTPEIIENYFQSEEFAGYYPYASNGVGFSYMFEYFGVRRLKHDTDIPADAVFLPGHTGDFLGGSHISKTGIRQQYSLDALTDKIYTLKYNYIVPDNKHAPFLKNAIKQYLKPLYGKYGLKNSYTFIEDWDYRERLAKTIANSSNVYSYFGYQYRLPFWDRELVGFFCKVPYEYKLYKRFYNKVLEEFYFRPNGILFDNELKASAYIYKLQLIKNRIKPYLPFCLKKQSNLKADWANYHFITAPMVKQLQESGIDFSIYNMPFNVVIMQWYLARLRNQIPG
jgi:asparagine synthase (glutamine-hydrolysing)